MQYQHDRECAQEGCAARLSRYNPSTRCGIHKGWQDTAGRSYG